MKNETLKRYLIIAANVLLAGFILATLAAAGLVTYYISSAPALTEEALAATTSSKIYDKDGALIADHGSRKAVQCHGSEIPTDLVNAIVAIEDQRFFATAVWM